MSPLFGKKNTSPREGVVVGSAKSAVSGSEAEPGSPIEALVARLDGLALTELGSEVMTGVMNSAERQPGELFNVARVLAFAVGGLEAADAAEQDPRMRDLVGEGVQVLEQARLVRLEAWQGGQFYHVGYVPTRLGRAAVEQNAVERILAGGSL